MKRNWVEYEMSWQPGPMSFWVHAPQDGKAWHEAQVFAPPKPSPVVGRGYPHYLVEFDGFVFRFSSLEELRECIAVLSKKLLPTTRRLSAGRGTGPNSHWLSRLPSFVKAWSYREKAVAYLSEVLGDHTRAQSRDRSRREG